MILSNSWFRDLLTLCFSEDPCDRPSAEVLLDHLFFSKQPNPKKEEIQVIKIEKTMTKNQRKTMIDYIKKNKSTENLDEDEDEVPCIGSLKIS